MTRTKVVRVDVAKAWDIELKDVDFLKANAAPDMDYGSAWE
jgi:hypothetical protein